MAQAKLCVLVYRTEPEIGGILRIDTDNHPDIATLPHTLLSYVSGDCKHVEVRRDSIATIYNGKNGEREYYDLNKHPARCDIVTVILDMFELKWTEIYSSLYRPKISVKKLRSHYVVIGEDIDLSNCLEGRIKFLLPLEKRKRILYSVNPSEGRLASSHISNGTPPSWDIGIKITEE
jgi:hypothetical protein